MPGPLLLPRLTVILRDPDSAGTFPAFITSRFRGVTSSLFLPDELFLVELGLGLKLFGSENIDNSLDSSRP
jgi:hypothetical protein